MANYKKDTSKSFVNPYNFVSIDKENVEKNDIEDLYKSNLLHGIIQCSIHVKTPLCIPDVEGMKEEKKHKIYKFFRLPDQTLAIPGSTIHGMLRSEYEALTNSCLSTSKPTDKISARTEPTSPLLPGLLIRNSEGKWALYSAKRHLVALRDEKYKKFDKADVKFDIRERKINELTTGTPVYFESDNKKYIKKDKKTWKEYTVFEGCVTKFKKDEKNPNGYLVIGETFARKHGESIFVKNNKKVEESSCIQGIFESIETTLDVYRDSAINRTYQRDRRKNGNHGYPDYEKAKANGVVPVYYSDKLEYFSFAAIGRYTYKNDMSILAGARCNPKMNASLSVCKACALFGYTGDNTAISGRLSVSDAVITKNSGPINAKPLKILGSPRPSYLPFYCKGRDYDNNGTIRGRKFYWHQPEAAHNSKIYLEPTGSMTEQNTSNELLNVGSELSFNIKFNGITQQQLNEIIWLLSLRDSDNENYCHKLGHGKPIGLGSVKIKVESVGIRDLSNGYEIQEYKDYTEPIFDPVITAQMLRIMQFDAMARMNVSYPYILPDKTPDLKPNVLASHQWFTKNKYFAEKKMPDFQPLPNIEDDDQILSPMQAYEIEEKDKFNKNSSKRR